MVVFSKRSKSGATSSSSSSKPSPSQNHTNAGLSDPKRWSDVATGRKSTHPSLSRSRDIFGTFELCEMILNYLPMKDVVRTAQVCRDIQGIIANSSKLQAKLFLTPDRSLKKLAVPASGTLLSGTKAEQHIAAAKTNRKMHTDEIALFVLHPVLKSGYLAKRLKHHGMVQYAANFMKDDGVRSENVAGIDMRDFRLFHRELDLSQIGKMFLSQPPVKNISLWFSHGLESFGIDVGDPEGVTIGQVLKAVRDTLENHYDGTPETHRIVHFELKFRGGFVVSEGAQILAQEAEELTVESDPTRWVHDPNVVPRDPTMRPGGMVLKKGGVEF